MNKIKVSKSEFNRIHRLGANALVACYKHPLGLVAMMDPRYLIIC